MGEKRYNAAGYLRLSDKDLHLDALEQSESIENQRNIILEYVKKNPDIKLVRFFIDDGYTGLNYERESYQEMMRWIDRGKINMIITKELSRLGREHAETIRLFKQDFVRKKIRYVAVIDNIDFNGRIEGIDIPFKVMINDYYSQNLSNTITKTIRNMQKQGKCVAAWTPYGYQKDPDDKHKVIIDPYAAKVVKRIYTYYSQGYSIDWICRKLSAEKIPNPSNYKKQFSNFKCGGSSVDYWTYTSIWNILKSEMYTGVLVQHKTEKVTYNLPEYRKVPDEDIIKIPNAVEAIVSREEWEQVQELMIRKRRPQGGDGSKNLFAGLIRCGDCGRSLGRVKDHYFNRWYYRCNTYARMGKEYCTIHKIQESVIQDIVLQAIKKNALASETFQNIDINIRKENLKSIENQNEKIIEKLSNRLENMEQERVSMLGKLARGILTEEDFLLYKSQHKAEKERLEYQILDLQNEQENTNIVNGEYELWAEEFIKYKHLEKLTREIVLRLVKSVIVYENEKVEITFRFKNPFDNI